MKLALDDPRHGTNNGYKNLGCRCDDCRKAGVAWHREWLHRTGRVLPWDVYVAERRANLAPHGTETRYTGPEKCRCAQCKEASRLAKAARRAKRVAAGFPYA
jgi:hypothetical protein